MSTRKQCAVKKVVTEELPPGWTVEKRVRKKKCGDRKRKTDKFYIDPVTGRIFCSMKQVLHYLETGEMTRKSRKTHLHDQKLRGGAPSVPAEEVNKRVSEITTRKSALQCQVDQVDKDSDSKSLSEGEGGRLPIQKSKKKITRGTVKRVSTLIEDKQQDEMTNADFPGNTSALLSAQADVPETSTSVDVNRITDSGNDDNNDEKEAAIQEEVARDEVDELKGRNMNNETHEIPVLKLREGNVELNKSLEGMHGPEVHLREEKLRDVLKKLSGPVLLPAGYIPLPPYHHIGTFGNNGNVTEPFDSPPTLAIPTAGDTAAPNNNLPPNSAPPNIDGWGDPCFDFAVRILASETKLAGDHPGVPSSFQHRFNSSKAQ